MVHICNFCPRKVFDNVLLMFTDSVMILPYTFFTMESPRITVVGAFGLENVNFLTITWDWIRSLF